MPSTTRQCETCLFRYAQNHFRASSTCLLCHFQRRLDESDRRHDESCRRYDELANKFSILQEFVASNIGCSTEAALSYATVAAASRPTTSPSPPTPNPEAAFTPVRNGYKAANKPKSFLPITTSNRFSILAEEEEEEHETRLIGDSIVRGQLDEFCGRARAKRKRLCMPGARLDDITAACEEATSNSDANSLFILHAGTNDVKNTRSEELLEKYKKMIQTYKNKTNSTNIIISGILPRIQATDTFYSKAFSTNNRLKTLCSQEGVEFINMWDDFFDRPDLFWRDGLHLSGIGSARFGRLLSDKVSLFRQKNQVRTPANESS